MSDICGRFFTSLRKKGGVSGDAGLFMEEKTTKIRLKVTPRVARLIAPEATAEQQVQAIDGVLPLTDGERLTAFFLLGQRGHEEVRRQAIVGLRDFSASRLLPLLTDEELHPHILQFVVHYRMDDLEIMDPLLCHSQLDRKLLNFLARRGEPALLNLLARRFAGSPEAPALCKAAAANPAVDEDFLALLAGSAVDDDSAAGEVDPVELPPDACCDEEEDAEVWEEDSTDEAQSKYQMTMHMGVAEKVKAALSGDKEWRKILVLDTNKLVSAAVLKNPRISEGEVLTVAKNKSSNEELIRIITQNREWMKNYAIRQALVVHPRVPMGQALRYMSTLVERDLKLLARSRDVSQVIVNNARRLLNARQQRR